jgi:hypothetical protein
MSFIPRTGGSSPFVTKLPKWVGAKLIRPANDSFLAESFVIKWASEHPRVQIPLP